MNAACKTRLQIPIHKHKYQHQQQLTLSRSPTTHLLLCLPSRLTGNCDAIWFRCQACLSKCHISIHIQTQSLSLYLFIYGFANFEYRYTKSSNRESEWWKSLCSRKPYPCSHKLLCICSPSFSMMTPSYSSMSNMSAASIQSFHSLQSFQSFQSSNSHQTLHTSQSLPLPPATRTPVVSAIQKSIHKPFAAARAMASTPVTGTRDRPVHSAASASARKKKAINPYIAFSMHMRKQRLQVDPFIGNRALILEIGQMWANMAASERLKYADLAKELNESLERESN
eukprot:TRINITY_DN594_c0_g1_i4.p1 TRINITY_DN594_c0_g1~~TRINITY_DN594_c0_g1_i4.p1  ORF type:complete len:283 (+),score=47.79 TRINITY_DN594_c0_g1_i4:359-1207(+)